MKKEEFTNIFKVLRKIRLAICFSMIFLVFSSLSAHSETIIINTGQKLKGRIEKFSQNGFQFYGEKYFFVQLDSVIDAFVDGDVNPEDATQQKIKIDHLLKIIDKEKFLVNKLGEQIRDQLEQKNYEALDQMAQNFLDKEERFPSGDWKLYHFYKEFKKDITSRDVARYLKRIKSIKEWVSQKPESSTAKICLMVVLRELAWAHRGGGYANTVSEKGGDDFKTTLGKVIELGNSLRSLKIKDPGFYVYLISASNGYGVSKEEIKLLANESADTNPRYFPTYNSTMYALLPRWGAERGELEEFAEWVVELTGESLGLEMYYRLVTSIKNNIDDRKYPNFKFDWEMLNNGFLEYKKNYLVLDRHYHQMAKLACLHYDREAARNYFGQTDGEWNHFAKEIWENPELLEQFKKWSLEDPDNKYDEIILAILGKKFPLLGKLLSQYKLSGGNINKTDLYGSTLLHILIEGHRAELVRFVLELDADVNKVDVHGKSPIYLAANNGNAEIAKILLAEGANSKVKTEKKQQTPLHIAARNGFEEVVNVLLDHDPTLLNETNIYQVTPFQYAAKDGHIGVVKQLLEFKDLNRDAVNDKGNTALNLAVIRGHYDIVKFIVESGVDINIKNKNNHTALSLAKEQGFKKIVSFLEREDAIESKGIITEEARTQSLKLYNEGIKYFATQNFQKAKELFLKAIELDPNSYLTYYTLAIGTWQFEGNPAKADEYMDKSIELNPNYVESYYWKGRINHSMGKVEVYKPLFLKYIKFAPETYNTKDLKQNYANLLVDNPTNIPSPTAAKKKSFLSNKNLIYGILVFLLFFLFIKSRMK